VDDECCMDGVEEPEICDCDTACDSINAVTVKLGVRFDAVFHIVCLPFIFPPRTVLYSFSPSCSWLVLFPPLNFFPVVDLNHGQTRMIK
jgi:hypothetical protein